MHHRHSTPQSSTQTRAHTVSLALPLAERDDDDDASLDGVTVSVADGVTELDPDPVDDADEVSDGSGVVDALGDAVVVGEDDNEWLPVSLGENDALGSRVPDARGVGVPDTVTDSDGEADGVGRGVPV